MVGMTWALSGQAQASFAPKCGLCYRFAMQRIDISGAFLPALVIAAISMMGQALAQDAVPLADSSKNCTCRFEGADYHLGDLVCLKSPDGPQLAQCGMVLNNTSWAFTGMGCTISMGENAPHEHLAASVEPQK